MARMSIRQRRLGWVARRCFGLCLCGLVVIAALVNVAFCLSLFDNWALIRLIGPLVVFGAAFVVFMFAIGFLVHAVGVLVYGWTSKDAQPQHPQAAAEIITAGTNP